MTGSPLLRVVAFAVALLLGGGVAYAGDTAQRLQEAEMLLDGGWVRTAIPLLESVATDDPSSAEAHFLLGVAYFEAGENREARASFERTLILDTDNWRAHYNLGAGFFLDRLWDEAVASFLSIPELAPQMAASAYLNAALARYQQGRPALARGLFQKVLRAEHEGPNRDRAGEMLSLLADAQTSSAGQSGMAPGLVRTRAVVRVTGALTTAYDTNPMILPDDPLTIGRGDLRSALTFGVGYRMALTERYRLWPRYDFYGHWYADEIIANYRVHRFQVRLSDQGLRLRPRIGYSASLSALGGSGYLLTQRLDSRVTLYRDGAERAVWAGVHVAIHGAQTDRFKYLEGQEVGLSGSAETRLLRRGKLYTGLAVDYLDRDDQTLPGGWFRSHSYTEASARVRVSHPLPWLGLSARGGAHYQFRSYHDADTWGFDTQGNPVNGHKRRYDHQVSGSLAVTRVVSERLTLSLTWDGTVNNSNIGNDPGDDRDRDFSRNIWGVRLRGAL
jgi:tetratricopeptide (TPR) repeat protein